MSVTVRTRKFIRNPLLQRKQFVVDVIHPDRPNVPKSELQELLAKAHKVKDTNLISLFGFRNKRDAVSDRLSEPVDVRTQVRRGQINGLLPDLRFG